MQSQQKNLAVKTGSAQKMRYGISYNKIQNLEICEICMAANTKAIHAGNSADACLFRFRACRRNFQSPRLIDPHAKSNAYTFPCEQYYVIQGSFYGRNHQVISTASSRRCELIQLFNKKG